MHNPIQHLTVSFPLLTVAEDAPAERGAIEGSAFAIVRGLGQEQVGCCGTEVREDFAVPSCAWLDYLAGQEVGVDDWKGMWGLGKETGDGGFAGGDGASETDEEHFSRWVGGGLEAEWWEWWCCGGRE